LPAEPAGAAATLADVEVRAAPAPRSGRAPWIAIGIIAVFMIVAALAPWLSPADPEEQSLRQRFTPPAWMDGGSSAHLLGTDRLGRDMLSRLFYGSRVSLSAGVLTVLLASAFGAARSLAPWRKLAGRVPPRPRSVILGVLAALAVLTVCGALLCAISLVVHLGAYQTATAKLSPGIIGSVLLLLASLCYLPNSVIWAICYLLGPGFSFGLGTAVSPAGSALGKVPAFPMLAALPVGDKAAFPAWLGFFVLITPYLAGALAGLMTVRIAPTPSLEAAPLWGLLTGSLAAGVIGFCAKVSGGPLGAGRLASVGPASGEATLVAVLEVGVTAALVAGTANWLIIRHHVHRLTRQPGGISSPLPTRVSAPQPALIIDETDDAGGHRIHVNPWADDPAD